MKKLLFVFLSILFINTGCSSDDDPTEPVIPKNEQFPVHLNINRGISKPDAILSTNNTVKEITEPRIETETLGFKGILMYNNKSGLFAYDLACPNCWNGNVLTRVGTPDNRYECKICGLDADLEIGRGYLWYENGKISKSLDLIKYKLTKLAADIFLVTNPSK